MAKSPIYEQHQNHFAVTHQDQSYSLRRNIQPTLGPRQARA